ncbi:hypothetical protein GGX14DRAFT_594112 [Mycena pura]|uniref:Uncharacterized protein n=1 Tax=Mycena pura TaxID=153505 RepID=A0AAD6UQV5_9AGAR|nr:hypothetical protein GGX14DRAFT_594112 [Mycena pura]
MSYIRKESLAWWIVANLACLVYLFLLPTTLSSSTSHLTLISSFGQLQTMGAAQSAAEGAAQAAVTDIEGAAGTVETDVAGAAQAAASDVEGAAGTVETDVEGAAQAAATDIEGAAGTVETDIEGAAGTVETDIEGAAHGVETALFPPPTHTSTTAATQPPPTTTAVAPTQGTSTSPPQATPPPPPPTAAPAPPASSSAPSSAGPAAPAPAPVESAIASASDPAIPQSDPFPAFITASLDPSPATPSSGSTQEAESSANGSKHVPVEILVIVPVLGIAALVAAFIAYRLRRRRTARVQQQSFTELGGSSRTSMSQFLTSVVSLPGTQTFATEAAAGSETRTPSPRAGTPPRPATDPFRTPPSAPTLHIPDTGTRWQPDPLGPYTDTPTSTSTSTLSAGPRHPSRLSVSPSVSPSSISVYSDPDDKGYLSDVEPSAAEAAAPTESDHTAAGAAALSRVPTFATVDPSPRSPPPYDSSWQPPPVPRLPPAGARASRPLPRPQST